MAILLYRVDERLIHGQVTLGWGGQLHFAHYVVVDDSLAESEWERELFRLGVPQDSTAEFRTVQEARERITGWRASPEKMVLLTRDLDHVERLARDGILAGESINLGGIHYVAGRRERLPYVYLNTEDEGRIRALLAEGVGVYAQDLTTSTKTSAGQLLDG
jgi:PTS system mannose-specific IIB component/fructoselysine and glucoselysine-specific PTS system IIB component